MDYEAPSDATTPTSCYSLDSYAGRKQGIPAGGFFAPGFVGQPPFKEEGPRAPIRELGELQQQLEQEGGADEMENRMKLNQTVIAETKFEVGLFCSLVLQLLLWLFCLLVCVYFCFFGFSFS